TLAHASGGERVAGVDGHRCSKSAAAFAERTESRQSIFTVEAGRDWLAAFRAGDRWSHLAARTGAVRRRHGRARNRGESQPVDDDRGSRAQPPRAGDTEDS